MNFHPFLVVRNKICLKIFRILNVLFSLTSNKLKLKRKIIKELNTKNKKVLIIHTLNLGDLIVSTPVITSFHSFFPKAEIDILIKKSTEQVFENNPLINEIFFYDEKNLTKTIKTLKKRKYLLVIDLNNSFIGLKRVLLALRIGAKYRLGFTNKFYVGLFNHLNARWKLDLESEVINYHNILKPLIPGLSSPKGFELYFSGEEKKALQSIISNYKLKKEKFIVMHPYSQNPRKYWSVEKFAKLAERLNKELRYEIIITGSNKQNEKKYAESIQAGTSAKLLDLTGKLTIREWFLIISEADLLITIDTSAIHVATATNTPTVALFGSSNRIVWRPYNQKNQLMVHTNVCAPCEKDFIFKECKFGDFRCMKSIEVEDVFAAAKKLLADKN